MSNPKIGSTSSPRNLKTQKGLEKDDVVVIIGEEYRSATFSVSFPECEKFAKTKHYMSKADCLSKIDGDTQDFKDNLAGTIFTTEAAQNEDEEKEVVNDSMKSIFNDWITGKAKLFG